MHSLSLSLSLSLCLSLSLSVSLSLSLSLSVCVLRAFCIVHSYVYVNNNKKAAYFALPWQHLLNVSAIIFRKTHIAHVFL